MTLYYTIQSKKHQSTERVYNLPAFAVENNINIARVYDTFLNRNNPKCPQWYMGFRIIEQVKMDRNDLSPMHCMLYDCDWMT